MQVEDGDVPDSVDGATEPKIAVVIPGSGLKVMTQSEVDELAKQESQKNDEDRGSDGDSESDAR